MTGSPESARPKPIDLSTIPSSPGCYLYKDKEDNIIYVGKAKDLKKRVSSYFSKDHDKVQDTKTSILVRTLRSADFIVTDTEVEALILENNLIKKHQPRFNINLKDSKRYAFLKLTDEPFPRLVLARRRDKDGRYFGPFTSATTRDYIHNVIKRSFRMRTCRKMPKRPCLRYHMGSCSAPCIGNVTEEDYTDIVRSVELTLKGHTKQLVADLNRQMKDASERTDYELALELRNRLYAIEWLDERQKMERQKRYDEDIINCIVRQNKVYLILFNVERGVLLNKQDFEFDWHDRFLEEFLVQYYSDNDIPKEIILPVKPDRSIRQYLEHRRKSSVRITIPKIGEKRQLLALVNKNIEATFFGETEKLEDLRKRLRLQEIPRVIECFDISHLSGTSTVASMVQFRNGRPDKSNYRRFRIRTVEDIDDFRAIAEVVRRRYTRLISEKSDLPDLIILDGGKGQLHAAIEELKILGLNIPTIGIAKRFEEIFVPGLKVPLNIPHNTKALRLLQAIRDEAHRFAIKYNRLLRSKALKSKS